MVLSEVFLRWLKTLNFTKLSPLGLCVLVCELQTKGFRLALWELHHPEGAAPQHSWTNEETGEGCFHALPGGPLRGCVLDWELQSPIGCPCRLPLPALVAASALMDPHRWVLPFPDHHSNPKAPRWKCLLRALKCRWPCPGQSSGREWCPFLTASEKRCGTAASRGTSMCKGLAVRLSWEHLANLGSVCCLRGTEHEGKSRIWNLHS